MITVIGSIIAAILQLILMGICLWTNEILLAILWGFCASCQIVNTIYYIILEQNILEQNKKRRKENAKKKFIH